MQRKQLNDSPWVAQAGLKTSFCSPASLPPVQALPSAFQQGQPPGNTLLSEPSPPSFTSSCTAPAAEALGRAGGSTASHRFCGAHAPAALELWGSSDPHPASSKPLWSAAGRSTELQTITSLTETFFTPSFPSLPQCECSYLWSPNIVLARQHAALTCWGPVEFWIKQRAREGIPRGASQRDTPQLAAYQQVQGMTWERQVQVTQGGTLPGTTRC